MILQNRKITPNKATVAFTLRCIVDISIVRWMVRLSLGAIFAFPALATAQNYKETFPRIAGIEIASSNKITNPDYREALAKHDLLILGMWKGWAKTDDVSGEVMSIRSVVVDIKRRARAAGNSGILVGKYTVFNESSDSRDNAATISKWDKLHSEIGPGYPVNNDWYARTGNGENKASYPGNWLTNITEYVQRDSNGDTYPEWAVRADYNDFFRDIPELDIWYFDNWFYRPRLNVDWDGNGSNDDKNSEAVRKALRQGYANGLRRAKQLAPNLIMMGNVDGKVSSNDGMLTEDEFRGQLTALYEGAIGLSYSNESWAGWESMMTQYQTTIFNAQDGIAAMTVHGPANDYALMRYGLASCLMDNGYYYYTSIEEEYRSAYWYDEFDVDLGKAIDPPQFSPWKLGVYMRRFENGMVLVNPKGNLARTITIEPGYKRINGKQDPATNNGQLVTSVKLSPRDGIVLVRTSSPDRKTQPKPPVLSALME